ncbi:FCD domain-containing protein [Clostridium sp. DL1XJH146]
MSNFTTNKWLIKMSNSVHTIVQRYLILSGSLKKYSVDAIKEHKAILEAIKENNFIKAKELTSNHISFVKERILK